MLAERWPGEKLHGKKRMAAWLARDKDFLKQTPRQKLLDADDTTSNSIAYFCVSHGSSSPCSEASFSIAQSFLYCCTYRITTIDLNGRMRRKRSAIIWHTIDRDMCRPHTWVHICQRVSGSFLNHCSNGSCSRGHAAAMVGV
jgi:hypothetical protein